MYVLDEHNCLKGGKYDFPPIDAAIQAVAAELPDLEYVSVAGLTDKGDNLHFSSASARELGRRYFAEYQRLVNRVR